MARLLTPDRPGDRLFVALGAGSLNVYALEQPEGAYLPVLVALLAVLC